MEPSLYKYILNHSKRDQIYLVILSAVTLPLVYITLQLPKKIINLLEGMAVPSSLFGFEFDRVTYLMILSFAFLATVAVSGGLKYFLNVYRGALGERLLRRLRYELYQRVLRFPLAHFKRVSQGEIIPMITAETEPLGEFIGESFSLPVFQGGTLFTYLFFIFQQDLFLGLAAISLYPFQLYVIPRLQKKVNSLNKERVATVRNLSGRIGETVSGIYDVHANATSHYERAHISQRLGRIYLIRFGVYQRKFLIKFLNNFIAQLTPFFFYSIGGYFVLRGELSIGSMVAVLVAYKDLSGPWKELLSYYQSREDVKVKYSQVIQQFDPQNLIEPAIIDLQPETTELPAREIIARNIRYSEDGLYFSIDGASFNYSIDQHAAAVGLGNSGKDELAHIIARLVNPSSGNINIGDWKMQDIPEAITGRRIAYIGPSSYLFTGTVLYNLSYSLKHRPVNNPDSPDSKEIKEKRILAEHAGNTTYRYNDAWVEYGAIGLQDHAQFIARIIEILKCVELDEEIYQYGLQSHVDQSDKVNLAGRIMQARKQLRDEFSKPEVARLVEPFDHEKYNTNMTVSENLLFGTAYGKSIDAEQLIDHPVILQILEECGLTNDFLDAGAKIAEIMLDLFSDVEPNSELFEQFSFIDADDLPRFQQLMTQTRQLGLQNLDDGDKHRLMSLPFKLVIARHRLGLINETIQQKILGARRRINEIAQEKKLEIAFFDETQYNPRISVQDNILFGKLAYGQANAQQKINNLIIDVVKSLNLRNDIIEAGLSHEVGVGGSRLATGQRQKLALARGLIKSPDLLVVNEALSSLDTASERRLIQNVRQLMKSRGILWILGRVQLAEQFDSVLLMERGRIIGQGPYQSLKDSSSQFQLLLSAE